MVHSAVDYLQTDRKGVSARAIASFIEANFENVNNVDNNRRKKTVFRTIKEKGKSKFCHKCYAEREIKS